MPKCITETFTFQRENSRIQDLIRIAILLQNHLITKGYITDAWNIQLIVIIQHYAENIWYICI